MTKWQVIYYFFGKNTRCSSIFTIFTILMIFLFFLQGIANKRNDYNDAFERLATQEAQREFIFHIFFQKIVLLFSFFIFLKHNYVFWHFFEKDCPLIYLHLIFEKSSLKNQVWNWKKFKFLIFQTWLISSVDQIYELFIFIQVKKFLKEVQIPGFVFLL